MRTIKKFTKEIRETTARQGHNILIRGLNRIKCKTKQQAPSPQCSMRTIKKFIKEIKDRAGGQAHNILIRGLNRIKCKTKQWDRRW